MFFLFPIYSTYLPCIPPRPHAIGILWLASASSLYRHKPRVLPLSSPPVQGFLGISGVILTAFPDKAPRARPDDSLHAPLLSQEHGQLLCARFPREVAGRIGVQPFVHDPLAAPLRLRRPQRDLRVVGVRARRHVRAVRQDIRSGLPRREQHLVLEGLARLRIDGPAGGPRGADRCGIGVEPQLGRRHERIEVLGDGIVDGAPGYAEEIWVV